MKSFFTAALALAVVFGTAATLPCPVDTPPACPAPADGCCEHHSSNHTKPQCEVCPMSCANGCALLSFASETVPSPRAAVLRWRSSPETGPERNEPPPLPPPRDEGVS